MYQRVIPRDLFNEANLLKCYAQLYLCLDHHAIDDVSLDYDDEPFDIDQNQDSGGLYIRNITLLVRGQAIHLERPLNSRYAWPLYATTPDEEIIEVLGDNGRLSDAMLAFLGI